MKNAFSMPTFTERWRTCNRQPVRNACMMQEGGTECLPHRSFFAATAAAAYRNQFRSSLFLLVTRYTRRLLLPIIS